MEKEKYGQKSLFDARYDQFSKLEDKEMEELTLFLKNL